MAQRSRMRPFFAFVGGTRRRAHAKTPLKGKLSGEDFSGRQLA